MPPRKGTYNARIYHQVSAAKTVERLAAALATRARSGVMFSNVSSLAAVIAADCGQTAGNLRRNKTYRAMLEVYLSKQRGGSDIISDRSRDASTLRAKLLSAQLIASNAVRDKERLEKFIALNQSSMSSAQVEATTLIRTDSAKINEKYREAFECTAEALFIILRHAGNCSTRL